MAEVRASYAEIWEAAKHSPGGSPIPAPTQGFDEVDEEEARRRYEDAWQLGGVHPLQQFNDVLTNPESNAFAADFFRDKIRAAVHDPVVAELLTPKGYPIAAKRPVLDSNYFETFNRPNVHLVDIKDTPIAQASS